MTTAEILRAARDLIAEESRWTKRHAARDHAGRPIQPTEPGACRFCATGALRKICGNNDDGYSKAYGLLKESVSDKYVGEFNDTHTHGEVMEAFSKAIALADQEPSAGGSHG